MENVQVYKFGGASVRDAAAILNLCRIVREYGPQGPLVIVISAMGKTTNALEEIYDLAYEGQIYLNKLKLLKDFHWAAASELCKQLKEDSAGIAHNLYDDLHELLEDLNQQLTGITPRLDYDQQYDQIVGFGELLSSRLVAFSLSTNQNETWLDCRPLIRTNKTWREGQVNWTATETAVQAALPFLLAKGLVVTQGFLGSTASGGHHHPGPRRLRLHGRYSGLLPAGRIGNHLERRNRPAQRRP